MKELLVRTLSGAVLVALIIVCIMVSPWTCAALGLLIVAVGTFEMSRLQHIDDPRQVFLGELLAVGTYVLVALGVLNVMPYNGLMLLLPMLPFLFA